MFTLPESTKPVVLTLAVALFCNLPPNDLHAYTLTRSSLTNSAAARRFSLLGFPQDSLTPQLKMVINSPFWGHYGPRVVLFLAVVILESLLIGCLLLERRRRWKASLRLAASEERYRNVVEAQTDMICRYLPDTTLTFVNDAYCRYFQKNHDELIGSKFIDLIPVHAQPGSMQRLESILETANPDPYEHEVIKPNGTIAWHQWSDHVISTGENVELQGIGRDITTRKLAEQALLESHKKLEQTNEELRLATEELQNKKNEVQSVNEQLRSNVDELSRSNTDLNNLLASTGIGTVFLDRQLSVQRETPHIRTLLRRDYHQIWRDASKVLADGHERETEIPLEDGRWLLARLRPYRTADDKIDGVVVNCLDITERKHAEEALIVSEEFNRGIVESTCDCVKVLDLDGNLLYMSEQGQRLLEIDDIDPLLTTSWINFWQEEHRVNASAAVKSARQGRIGSFEGFGRTMKGNWRWWDTVITPMRSPDGSIQRLLAISRDITEQKTAINAIRESEERFAKVFEANPQPMSLTTLAHGKYLHVNESFERMSGYAREEIIGRTSLEIEIFETRNHRQTELVQPLLKNGSVRNAEIKFRTKSGEIRVLLSSAELLEIDGQQCIIVASSDISERKALEENLRLSEREFSTLVENSPDIITRLDRNLRYIYISPVLERISSVQTGLFIGKTPREITIGGYGWEDFEAGCQEAFDSGKQVRRAFAYNGRNYWTRIIPEFSADGTVESVMTISEDVTDRIRAEQELVQLTARLFTLQDEERRRIARELHDGTAQNLFAISVNLAKLGQPGAANRDDASQLIAECQALGDQSLQEIRTLSYLLHPPLLDQVGLVSALQWYIEGFTKRSGIYVDFYAQPIGRLPSDIEMALFRIVQEALTNVRRHSASETANIRLERQNGEVVLEIKDRGRGLSLTKQNGEPPGLLSVGVGIPGMRQRLRQLGGNLEIRSNDHGTTISAIVPLKNGAKYGTNTYR